MGTLRIKGDSAALCYWNAHEKSKETFAGDWCTTGDQFHVDDEGYYWYHGRTDDMLKVSGIFVAPAEIENCLLQHEAVLECAVIGHDSGDGLVKPKAFVVLRDRSPKSKVQSPKSDRVSDSEADPAVEANRRIERIRQVASGALQVPPLDRVCSFTPEKRSRQDRSQTTEARLSATSSLERGRPARNERAGRTFVIGGNSRQLRACGALRAGRPRSQ